MSNSKVQFSCSDGFNKIVSQIQKKYPVLSREQEVSLSLAYKNGDLKALETLILSNVGIWRMYAMSCKNPAAETEDLFQEMIATIIEKAGKFDATKSKFATYMSNWCHLVSCDAISGLSSRDKKYLNTILMASEYFSEKNNRPATDDEVREITGWSEKKFNLINQHIRQGSAPLSLNSPAFNESDDKNSSDFIENVSSKIDDPFEELSRKRIYQAIKSGLKTLSPKEKFVFTSFYNLETGEKTQMCSRKLAEIMNVSRTTVCNLRKSAERRLRNFLLNHGYCSYDQTKNCA